MIVVEPDDGLADCVTRFFSDRYEVTRVGSLGDAEEELRVRPARILFAEIDRCSGQHSSLIERIHRDHPRLKIVLTYHADSAKDAWNMTLSASADMLVRKPYGVLEVDKVMRAVDGGGES